MVKKPLWICVSGIDGSGKTTLCKTIVSLLGEKATFMKIPYFDWVRDMIKVSGNNTPNGDTYTDALIFSAANRLELVLIEEQLSAHNFLVTQRCWLDNFPYRLVQGMSLKESTQLLKPQDFSTRFPWNPCGLSPVRARSADERGCPVTVSG